MLLPEGFVFSLERVAVADRRRFLPEPAVLGDVVDGPVLALQLAAGPLLAGDLARLFGVSVLAVQGTLCGSLLRLLLQIGLLGQSLPQVLLRHPLLLYLAHQVLPLSPLLP